MSLRVIAGLARGMRLKPVPGDSTRPIMDRVKEALFSIIGNEIRGTNFLDLFAGTGSVGIEALSRGAAFAVFVDRDRKAINTVHNNLSHTRLDTGARVRRQDAFDLLANDPDRLYHFIFVAPPQYKTIWLRTLDALDRNAGWHHDDSLVIVQIDPKEYESERQFENLELVDQRVYGRTMLLFYAFARKHAE